MAAPVIFNKAEVFHVVKLVTRIAKGRSSQGNDLWIVGVDGGDQDKPIVTLPCFTEEQAEIIARQIEALISHIAGQPDLGDSDVRGST